MRVSLSLAQAAVDSPVAAPLPQGATRGLADADATGLLPLSMVTYPFRLSVRAVRGVRPEVTSVKLEHGEEVVSVLPLENPVKMNVKVRVGTLRLSVRSGVSVGR